MVVTLGSSLRIFARESLRRAGFDISRNANFYEVAGKRNIHFLHIGKNAGTQISHMTNTINQVGGHANIIRHGHDTYLRNLPTASEYFFSIRNPISRFKSGFYSHKRKGQPLNYYEWTESEANAFRDFDHANDLAEAIFEEGMIGQKAYAAIKSLWHIGQNQSDFFAMAGNIFEVRPPVAIIRQEHFESDFVQFKRKIAVDLETPVVSRADNAHKTDYSDIPKFSEKAISNLKSWYCQDLEFYKRCERWIKSTE